MHQCILKLLIVIYIVPVLIQIALDILLNKKNVEPYETLSDF